MKKEISAGGVIMRNIGSRWEVLLLEDMNGTWTFPKGIIEKGESIEEAARREVGEEVSIFILKLVAPLTTISYTYRNHGLVEKTVHYFLYLATGDESPVPQKSEGIQNVRWYPFDEAMEKIGYAQTNRPILLLAQQQILGL